MDARQRQIFQSLNCTQIHSPHHTSKLMQPSKACWCNKKHSLIRRDFIWKGMHKDVDMFIQNCNTCRHHKLQSNHIVNPHGTCHKTFWFNSLWPSWPFHPPSSKGNSHILLWMCFLTNYPIAIPIPDKHTETVIQEYLKHVYATFGGSQTMITDNGKEFKNDLFKRWQKNKA